MQNPVVMQAYNGFMAYDPLYKAGCLKDLDGTYCYAEAATNATPSSGYVYYLPLGVPLPSSTRPTCSKCLRDTMSVFSTYAAKSKQALSTDYSAAAQQVDISCGPRFVEATVQTSSSPRMTHGRLSFLSVMFIAASYLL